MLFRRIMGMINSAQQTVVFAYLTRCHDGVNGRLGRSLFLLTRFSVNQGCFQGRSAHFNNFTRREPSAYVHVLSGESYVAIGISELFQVRDRVFANVRFRSGMFRYARSGSAYGVIHLFLYRTIRFTRFLENFFNYHGRFNRRIVDVRRHAFA